MSCKSSRPSGTKGVAFGAGLVIAVMVIHLALPVSVIRANSRPLLTMKVVLSLQDEGRYVLEITLMNKNAETISISAMDLPWVPVHWASWLKATKLDKQRTVLETGGPLIDYGGQLAFSPGDEKSGKVPLHLMFDNLSTAVQSSGVQLDWRCPTDLLAVECPDKGTRYILSKGGIRRLGPNEPATEPSKR